MFTGSIGLLLNDIQMKSPAGGIQSGNAELKQSGDGLFASMFDQALKTSGGKISNTVSGDTNQKQSGNINQADFMENFRNRLMSTGVSLEKLSISSDSIPELKQLLVAQGYAEKDVSALLSNLFKGNSKQRIWVSELFQELSSKKTDLEKGKTRPVINASLIPNLENALLALGFNASQISNLIETSRTTTGDLNLYKFVQKLKTVQPDENKLLLGDEGKEVKNFLKNIVKAQDSELLTMTLQRFTSSLEEAASMLQAPKISSNKIEKNIQSLMSDIVSISKQIHSEDVRKVHQAKLNVLQKSDLDVSDESSLKSTLQQIGLSSTDIQKIIGQVKNSDGKIDLSLVVSILKSQYSEVVKGLSDQTIMAELSSKKQSALVSLENMLANTIKNSDESKTYDKLKSMLVQMGLDPQIASNILDDIKEQDGKISIDKLIASLKDVLPLIPKDKKLDGNDLKNMAILLDDLTNAANKTVNDNKQTIAKADTLEANEKKVQINAQAILKEALIKQGLSEQEASALIEKAQTAKDTSSIQVILQSLVAALNLSPSSKLTENQVKDIENIISKLNIPTDVQANISSQIKQNVISLNAQERDLKDFTKQQLAKSTVDSNEASKKEALQKIDFLLERLVQSQKQNNEKVIPSTLEMFVKKLESMPEKIVSLKTGEQVSIPSKNVPELQQLLKELGLVSMDIKKVVASTEPNGDLPVKKLVSNLNDIVSRMPEDTQSKGLREAFDRIEKLIAKREFVASPETEKATFSPDKLIRQLNEIGKNSPNGYVTESDIASIRKSLSKLGLSEAQIQLVVNQSKDPNGQITLQQIAQNLKSVIKEIRENRETTDNVRDLGQRKENQTAQKVDFNTIVAQNQETAQNDKQARKADFKASNQTLDKSPDKFLSSSSNQNGQKDVSEFGKTIARQTEKEPILSASKKETAPVKNTETGKDFINFLKQDVQTTNKLETEPSVRTEPRAFPQFIMNQVGKGVSTAITNGDQQMRIELRPPNLGALQLDMEIHENVLRISMAADKQSTKDILINHMTELKDALAEHGIKIDKVDVQVNYNADQFSSKEKSFDQGQFAKHNSSSNQTQAQSQESVDNQEVETSKTPLKDDSSLSIVA